MLITRYKVIYSSICYTGLPNKIKIVVLHVPNIEQIQTIELKKEKYICALFKYIYKPTQINTQVYTQEIILQCIFEICIRGL